jgi:hypothetical protein
MSDELREMLRESINDAKQAEPVESDVSPGPDGASDVSAVGSDGPVESGEPSGTGVPGESAASNSEAGAAARARDSSGKFAKAEKSATQAPKPTEAPSVTPAPKTAAEPSGTPVPVPGETSTALKAPQSWKPGAREEWAKIPPAAQAEISRVNREMAPVMMENAKLREFRDSFKEALGPFESHLRASGRDPVKEAQSMMRAGYVLETGQPKQKAALLAYMIKEANVTVDDLAEALDGGQGATEQPRQQGPFDEQAIIRRAKEEFAKDLQAQRQEALNRKSIAEVEKFKESHEHFEHVKQKMRLLQLAANQTGDSLSLDDAYTMAVKLDPELSQYEQQRMAAKAATSQNEATARARAAASSVKSEPAMDRPTSEAQSVRGLLRQSIAEAKRR